MKVISFGFILSLLILSGCEEKPVLSHGKQTLNDQIIFFSDGDHYEKEIPYYDALLDIKTDHPKAFRRMIVVSPKDQSTFERRYHITSYPSILIVKKDRLKIKIEGKNSSEKIVQILSKSLEGSNDGATAEEFN
ncbi:hypothetical protein [Falsibacillus pallidus]|uniref:hypothetical protein n=1 Tax=Falsibacillus pallidus TaxID=493781 RepID=UPI003D965960